MELNVWTVALAAAVTAIATGLGAIPFFFVQGLSRKWLGLGNGIASGLMLGASFGLIVEGMEYSWLRMVAGILVGVFFITLSHHYLENHNKLEVGDLEGANALKALMIVGVMTLHSFAEGVGVGVSFGGGQSLGLLITTAIAIHNIPEGLAISLVLVPQGTSAWRAALWSVFSSLPQPLMAVPAFLFVTAFEPILPAGLGFAAGAMIWMVFAEIIPDALEETESVQVALAVTLAFAAMVALQQML